MKAIEKIEGFSISSDHYYVKLKCEKCGQGISFVQRRGLRRDSMREEIKVWAMSHKGRCSHSPEQREFDMRVQEVRLLSDELEAAKAHLEAARLKLKNN